MKRIMLKSKIHRAKVTDVNKDYEGSIAIDHKLMQEAHIYPYEQVHVWNVTNGNRFITYAIAGDVEEICINGAAAHKAEIGDEVIICAFTETEDTYVSEHDRDIPTIINLGGSK